MGVSELRGVLAGANPFVLGRYPDRPAPAHVLNGLVVASLGSSSRGAAIRKLLEGVGPPDSFTFLGGGWASDDIQLKAFREDMSAIFNPDRRMWEDIGSPVPVHAHLATSDPSDDGLGRAVWDLVRAGDVSGATKRLGTLLMPKNPLDPVTASAHVLVSGAPAESTPKAAPTRPAWYGDRGTPAGRYFAKSLARFLTQLVDPVPEARRLLQIQHLGRGAYLTAFLATVLGPIAATAKGAASSVDQLATLVVWCGMPPGPTDHPMVEAAARSFQEVVNANQAGLARLLQLTVSGRKVPSTLPVNQRRRVAFESLLIENGFTEKRAAAAVEALAEDAHFPISGDVPKDEVWYRKLIESTFPSGFLTKGFRSMGRKIGIVGPDRGFGSPRFLCETPLIGTLVAGLCPSTGLEFADFVDTARERLGLVVGLGRREELAGELRLWESAGTARRLLRENEEALRQRMVRAGLAREYSDGHTEVIAAHA